MTSIKRALVVASLAMAASSVYADIVVVTSAKAGIADLNKQQVSDLFLGKSSTFPDGKQAVPLEQVDGAAAREEFHGKVTGKTGAQLKAFWSKQVFSGKGTPPKELPGSADVKKLVADNPNMIGYVDKSAVDGSLKVVFTP
jgi:ABC-type phosphate transport system substrate-binding protein